MDDVVGGDAVGGDHQQVVTEVVDLPDLALGEEREIGRRRGHDAEASNAIGSLWRYGESEYGKSVKTSAPSSVTSTRSSSRQPPKPGR